MKILKHLVLGLIGLVVVLVIGIVIAVNVIDPNDYKDFIEEKTQTAIGRELSINGEIKLSYFPWIGIKLGEIVLANAEGFQDTPFARIDHANVKVEVMPLLQSKINARTVELGGLTIDLHRAADGTTNWDDLASGEPAATSPTDNDNSGEGAIAALEVGGIEITDAVINWRDDQAGVDARVSEFDLTTGAITLAQPFDLNTSFKLNSDSIGIAAAVESSGSVMLDLEQQRYSLVNFKLDTTATGAMLPAGKLELSLATTVLADLSAQTIDAETISLSALGVTLRGNAAVSGLDAEPRVIATLTSDMFNPRLLLQKLGIEAPVTADEKALTSGSISVAVSASPAAATLDDLTIKLDDTTFKGSARLPDLAAAMPPARFEFGVDAIDLDRYLPPGSDVPADSAELTPTAEDTPIDLPLDLLRQLDVAGTFSVGELKVMNLTTRDIKVPLEAKDGNISLKDISASLYQGSLASTLLLNVNGKTPAYSARMALSKVESDPLLADLRQVDSPLSGNANFNADLSTAGNSVNGLTAGLNGSFDAAFLDGSINGINIGYQLRRARATLKGQALSADQKQVKTDFSSLSISGQFSDGVMTSSDLDMRSPLLRLSGAGMVDLPQEYLDYTPSILISGTTEGQGGKDLEELQGIQLDLPLKGKFDELSADFTGVLLAGLKANFTGAAKAKAKAAADKLKKQAKAKLAAEKSKAREQLAAKKAAAEKKARTELAAKKKAAKEKVENAKNKASKKLKDTLKGGLGDLLK